MTLYIMTVRIYIFLLGLFLHGVSFSSSTLNEINRINDKWMAPEYETMIRSLESQSKLPKIKPDFTAFSNQMAPHKIQYKSFENLNNWLRLMNLEYKIKENNAGFILVGNKVDLERNVSKDLVMTLVGENKYFHTYIETSSIYGVGVSEVLDKIVIMGRKLLNLSD